MLKYQKNKKNIFKLSVFFLLFALSIKAIADWSPPPGSPTGANTPPPINVGNAIQQKIGPLIVGGFLSKGPAIFDSQTIISGTGSLKITMGAGANKVLTSDAIGIATWQNATGGIDGSGTINYLPKFTPNGTTLGNSQIFDDGANIGIGTTLPIKKFDLKVNGINGIRVGQSFTAPGNDPIFELYHANNHGFRWRLDDANANLHLDRNSSGVYTNDILTVLRTSGFFGIGNNAPTEKLDVTGNVKFSGAFMPNNLAGTSGQYLKSNGAGLAPTWVTPTGGGITTVGAIDSQTKSANGLVISGSNIYAQTADASFPGLVSTGTQTFEGSKTFNRNITIPATFNNSGSPTGIIYKGVNPFIHNFNYGLNPNGVNLLGYNTFVGVNSGNLSMGATATVSNQSSYNTAIGVQSFVSNTIGNFNTAGGTYALNANTTGYSNAGFGSDALYKNTTGYQNSSLGQASLSQNTTGHRNVAIGSHAGEFLADGTTNNINSNNSLFLGYDTRALSAGGTNEIVIGSQTIGEGDNTVTLGNASITDTILRGKLKINGVSYTWPVSNGANGTVLTNNGSGILSWTAAGGGGVSDGDKGEITVSGTGTIWTIDDTVITNAKIANNAVDSLKILDNAVNNTKIIDNAITASKIASNAVTTLKIIDNAVTIAKISATGTPSSSTFLRGDGTWSSGSGILTLNGLSPSAQTMATGTTGTDFNISSSGAIHTFNLPIASATNIGKLSGTDWTTFNNKMPNPLTTAGDLLYRNATVPARLPIGANGQVLTVVGGLPAWAAPGSGADNLGNHIATQSLDMDDNNIFGSQAPGGTLILDSTSNSIKGDIIMQSVSGDVIIGAGASGSKLSVNGNISVGSYSGSAAPLNGMIISGNVGIGTSSPSELLSLGSSGIKGVLSLAGNTSGKIIIQPKSVAGSYTLTLPDSAGTVNQILSTDGTGNLSWITPSSNSGWIDNGSTVTLSTNTDNVGIGTSSPGEKLVVSGNAVVTGGLYATGGNIFGTGGTTPSLYLYGGTSAIPNGKIVLGYGSDKIGINENNPGQALDVSGSIAFSQALMPGGVAGTSGQYLKSNGAGLAPTWTTISGGGITTVGAIDSQTKSANGLVISGSNIYAQTADASFPGLVSTGSQIFEGIKTFNKEVITPLGLYGTTAASGNLVISSTTNATKGAVFLGFGTGDRVVVSDTMLGSQAKLAVKGNFAVGFMSSTFAPPTNGAIIEGKVGIGGMAGSAVASNLTVQSANIDIASFHKNTANTTGYIRVMDGPDFVNNAYILTGVDTTGGVMGGGVTGAYISSGKSGTGTAYDFILHQAINTKDIRFLIGTTERMRIANTSGNVGIGIGAIAATQKLEVAGGIRLNTTAAKPTCDAGTGRGTTWFTQGGAGVKDAFEVCAKDAAGVYAWRVIY